EHSLCTPPLTVSTKTPRSHGVPAAPRRRTRGGRRGPAPPRSPPPPAGTPPRGRGSPCSSKNPIGETGGGSSTPPNEGGVGTGSSSKRTAAYFRSRTPARRQLRGGSHGSRQGGDGGRR